MLQMMACAGFDSWKTSFLKSFSFIFFLSLCCYCCLVLTVNIFPYIFFSLLAYFPFFLVLAVSLCCAKFCDARISSPEYSKMKMYGYQASYVHSHNMPHRMFIVFVIQMSHPWKQISLRECSQLPDSFCTPFRKGCTHTKGDFGAIFLHE